MRIDIISLFPAMFAGPFGDSITKRAVAAGLLDIHILNPRQFAYDRHKQVDDAPFGGGSGMVLKPEPFARALSYIRRNTRFTKRRVILLGPGGTVFNQERAKTLAAYEQIILLCGHYEGFDDRVPSQLVDEELSIGDYVLTGGELPAMVVTDAVSRMIPGVLGSEESAPTDSFYDGILGFPQYTRPREYQGTPVPEVLISGDHAKIDAWRREEALRRTWQRRPELLAQAPLSENDRRTLERIKVEENSGL
ncbi:MAG: tRNA (guanosine(37)-N1)-methyltransferase TrmD [Schwartzia sp.]|nr:tRNA (guanosine(37)-N1)-methyltransferase TrmD [Schwartzia sp. (in: firmicutes)]